MLRDAEGILLIKVALEKELSMYVIEFRLLFRL